MIAACTWTFLFPVLKVLYIQIQLTWYYLFFLLRLAWFLTTLYHNMKSSNIFFFLDKYNLNRTFDTPKAQNSWSAVYQCKETIDRGLWYLYCFLKRIIIIWWFNLYQNWPFIDCTPFKIYNYVGSNHFVPLYLPVLD